MKIIVRNDNRCHERYWVGPGNGYTNDIKSAYVYDSENQADWDHIVDAVDRYTKRFLTIINVTDIM
jgi:hypothetical protein